MPKYSQERKESVLMKLLPPNNYSVAAISKARNQYSNPVSLAASSYRFRSCYAQRVRFPALG